MRRGKFFLEALNKVRGCHWVGFFLSLARMEPAIVDDEFDVEELESPPSRKRSRVIATAAATATSAVELFVSLGACLALLQTTPDVDIDIVALREEVRAKHSRFLERVSALFESVPALQVIRSLSRAWPLRVDEDGDDDDECVGVAIPSARIIWRQEEDEEEEEEEEPVIWLKLRSPIPPFPFPKQKQAFDFVDESFPPGLMWVWACDYQAADSGGAKHYLASSLDDFWAYYCALPPEQRSFYEVIRPLLPCALHFDLEYSLKVAANQLLDRRAMLEEFKRLVEQLWLEETGSVLDPKGWVETDSCGKDIVSFHLVHEGAGFANYLDHKEFMRRLVERAPQTLMATHKKTGKTVIFADIKIYTVNRLFRLTYSSKPLEERFLLPAASQRAEGMVRENWERSLVTRLRPEAVLHPGYPHLTNREPVSASSSSNSGGVVGEQAGSAGLIDALAGVIEEHFHPERMRERSVHDNGLCTFHMVLHNCVEVCKATHSNQVYAVADLRQRVFYAKCFKAKQSRGPDHRFPAMLESLRFVDGPGELVRNGEGNWSFPAESNSAGAILRFLRAAFGVDGKQPPGGQDVAARIPLPGASPVTLDVRGTHYFMSLGLCEQDGGELLLTMDLDGAQIRCVGGGVCSKAGWRLERPSRSSQARGTWNLLYLFPAAFPQEELARVPAVVATATGRAQQQFLDEPNFYRALELVEDGVTAVLSKTVEERLNAVELWAIKKQQECPNNERDANGLHPTASQVAHKAAVMRVILLDPTMEGVYRECLCVEPGFRYPLNLMPKGPRSLLVALWVHMASTRGFKRVGQEFYVPVRSTAEGEEEERIFYRAVPVDQMLTHVCPFNLTPNLCSHMWTARTAGDMERMLRDENHWPTVSPSKRYLGFRNVVYDLVENKTLPWRDARADPECVPFNYIAEDFPVTLLEQAKRDCPQVVIDTEKTTLTFNGPVDFVPTPLFSGALRDQEFDDTVCGWYYTFMGRMFHVVGKGAQGDNWEIMPVSIGAPGTFKSSNVSVIKSFVQDTQFGVIATRTEHRFPIAPLLGKLMVFLTETGGCDFDKELLKQMASGDPVTGAQKFLTASNLSNWDVPMWLAGNRFFDCRDTEGSLERRCAVFPFTRILPEGAGDVTLVSRIIATERIPLLIKCNTLYLAMKAAIRQPVQHLLPPLIREATRQALLQNDSLRLYLAHEYVISPDKNQHWRVKWRDMWAGYLEWCRSTGQRPYLADPGSSEVQTMFTKMGVRLHSHRGELWLLYMRRRNEYDAPFKSVFQVSTMRRAATDGDDFAWESEEEEEDEE